MEVEAYARTYPMTVWWASKVEAISAISRLYRMGSLTSEQREEAIEILGDMAEMWNEVIPNDELREAACRVLNLYALKAADSFQLAAALAWCRNRPANRVFICADRRLNDAAELAGFTVKRLNENVI